MPITLGAVGSIQIKPRLIRKHNGFPFLICSYYLFLIQSTRFFLYLAVKEEAAFLFLYTRFGDSWINWRTLLRAMGKFWDFCRFLELDCPVKASRKIQRLAEFVILGGRPGRFLVPYDSGSFRWFLTNHWDLGSSFAMKLIDFSFQFIGKNFPIFIFIKWRVPRKFCIYCIKSWDV